MVKRRAVAATVAAAFLFLTLVLSNSVLLVGVLDEQRLAREADAEGRLYDQGLLLSGTVALYLLEDVQSLLAGGVFQCSTASQAIARALEGLSASQTSGGVTATGRPSLAAEGPRNDNMSMLRPFNGSGREGLPTLMELIQAGHDPVSSVTFYKNENHVLSLPVGWTSLVRFCLYSIAEVDARIRGSAPDQCSAGAMLRVLSEVESDLFHVAESAGFDFALTYSVEPSSSCSVDFVSHVSQTEIDGPGGAFTVRLEQGGSAAAQALNSPWKARISDDTARAPCTRPCPRTQPRLSG